MMPLIFSFRAFVSSIAWKDRLSAGSVERQSVERGGALKAGILYALTLHASKSALVRIPVRSLSFAFFSRLS